MRGCMVYTKLFSFSSVLFFRLSIILSPPPTHPPFVVVVVVVVVLGEWEMQLLFYYLRRDSKANRVSDYCCADTRQ